MHELISNRGASDAIQTARRPRKAEVSGDESAVSGAQCLKCAAPRVHRHAGHLGHRPPCNRTSCFGYCVS